MPWKTSSVMEEKLWFVFEYEQGHRSMTELCQRYGCPAVQGGFCDPLPKLGI